MTSKTKPIISPCRTHHLEPQGKPSYARRFEQVLPFHPPGLAPVSDKGLAWHIHPNGEDAYAERFDRTFGFYFGVAAVNKAGNWFHINTDGQASYQLRFSFAGNFQSGVSVVCDNNGQYFHIDLKGLPLYAQRWRYCGDYREGSAVVQADNGLCSHINVAGEHDHNKWFVDLDVYHKGFAKARDAEGWHHVDRSGKPLYPARYAHIEPFYNGCSRVEKFNNSLIIIDETGTVIRELRSDGFYP